MATRPSMTPVTVEESFQGNLHEQIAALAYALWQERGCPEGSSEVDWLHAEEELKTRAEE